MDLQNAAAFAAKAAEKTQGCSNHQTTAKFRQQIWAIPIYAAAAQAPAPSGQSDVSGGGVGSDGFAAGLPVATAQNFSQFPGNY